jgi:hypothetical protein
MIVNETKCLLQFIGHSKCKWHFEAAYDLSKQLQDVHTDVVLLSETYFKTHEKFFTPNYHLYRSDRFQGRKGGISVAVRKGILHNHVDLPPLASVEATRGLHTHW